MPEPDDQQLLREFAETSSEGAFAALVARHVNLVYSTALRFSGNPHRAEEITQAVFIILARKAKSLGAKTILSGWLYQTARLTAANVVKSEIRRQRREQEAYMQSTLNEPDAAAWEQIAPLLDDAMGRLGETDRSAVVLRFFENKTAREVAAALQLTEAAAHKRVNRALDKLRKFFTKRGVDSTTAILSGAISAGSVHAAPVGLAKTVSAAALAKGAAASTSTLTLVKGALKIMAWTKAKTAIATGVAVILAATSTTVIGIKLARAHHPPAKPGEELLPLALNGIVDIQPDGTMVQFVLTVEETNSTTRTINPVNADSVGDVDPSKTVRITDELGKPMKFTPKPGGGIFVTLNRPIPPGGTISYTVEATERNSVVESKGGGEFAVDFSSDIGSPIETHMVQVWRLPAGATLLGKIRGINVSTNSGRIELQIDRVVPPNGTFPVGFRYRLPAR